MRKIILIILSFLLINTFLKAQTNKFHLSRQDSAKISSFHKKAIEYRNNNFIKQESDCYNEIAMIWWEHNFFSKAVEYYTKSLEINNKLANENAIAMINSNLALIYADKGDYNKSLEYFEKTLNIRTIKKEKVGIIAARINMSVVLNNLKRYDESIEHLSKALDVARSMNDPVQMRSCYGMLSETYEKAGNNSKSIYYFELYRQFNELVENKKVHRANNIAKEERLKKELAEKENEIKELELLKKNYEIKIKEKKIVKTENEKLSLLDTINHKDLKIRYIKNEAELEKSLDEARLLKSKLLLRNTILIASIILFLLLVFIVFYFQKRKTNKILNKKNTEILQKNEEIKVQKQNIEELYIETSEAHESIKKSINYAAFIQKSMINKTPKLSSYFKESFIIFKPKDAVGGDFYWYSKVDDKIVVAAVDCTGHGVPGAFLTVLGNNVLNQIVNISKITNPSEILYNMHNEIKNALNQSNSKNQDGMDMSLCTIDLKNKKLYFAGANNPLVIIKNNKVNVIKGNRYGIGGYSEIIYQRKKETDASLSMYNTTEVDIIPGMSIYLFSDGFQDQISEQTNKKIKSKAFYSLIEKYSTNPLEVQKEKFLSFFSEWKGNYEQVDDVLIIGIKF